MSLGTTGVLALFAVLAVHSATAVRVTIDNLRPRTDAATGAIIDAHDGSITQWKAGGDYYYYAMEYGLCLENGKTCSSCGMQSNNSIVLWTNRYLTQSNWTRVRDVFPADRRPNATYFRPHVIYNPSTRLYVLWVNAQFTDACPDGSQGKCYMTATSPTPEGPFEYHDIVYTKYTTGGGVGDFDLFVDDDGQAYSAFKRAGTAVKDPHRMMVDRLTPDFLHTTNETLGIFGQEDVEAPVMFKRNGTYYTLFGHCCCFCVGGSGVGLYASSNPMGPYVELGNIGCNVTVPLGCGCTASQPQPTTHVYGAQHRSPMPSISAGGQCSAAAASVTHSQQNVVFKVATSNGTEYMWTGDRWQSGPGLVKGWDFQYWTLLRFDDTVSPPRPLPLTWVDTFTVDVL